MDIEALVKQLSPEGRVIYERLLSDDSFLESCEEVKQAVNPQDLGIIQNIVSIKIKNELDELSKELIDRHEARQAKLAKMKQDPLLRFANWISGGAVFRD